MQHKRYDSDADRDAARWLDPFRQALRNYIKPASLIEHDVNARASDGKYFGPDMEVTHDGQHVAWLEDEIKGWWDGWRTFPKGDAHVSARPMKHKSDLFIQIRNDGHAIWVIPTHLIAACPVIEKQCSNNPDHPEKFYEVTESQVDTYHVLTTLIKTTEKHHGYLEAMLELNQPEMAVRRAIECTTN